MRAVHSIRWRLQFWYALLLAMVLVGFGTTAWRLDRATRLQRVDQELERRVGAIVNALRRGEPADRPASDRPRPGRPPGDEGAPGPPPPDRRPPEGAARDRLRPARPPAGQVDVRLPEREAGFFDPAGRTAYYYVVWRADGSEMVRSAGAPAAVPPPQQATRDREARSRGAFREFVHRSPQGEQILVGRDIGDEQAAMRRLAWLLAAAGLGVFALGLAGGWLVTTRSLRPIGDISATATRISNGDLSQRVPVAGADTELAELARVLNDTFERLQASFERQARFTADASHELRTPVSVILAQAQSALARDRSHDEYRESLAACQRAAQRMRRLIESLLTLARLDSHEADAAARSTCELDVIVRETVELLQPLATEHGVALTVELAPARCTGNAEQLGQVAANLVTNAIRYNRPGGSVRVKCGHEGGAVTLSVCDTGRGISAEDLPHVFERFYRADKARSSNEGSRAGLGLAIAKAIVEAHGGSIDAVSEPGQGSTFAVRLKAAPTST